MSKLSAILVILILLSGCYTLEQSDSREAGRDQLLVSNYGWYLFGFIPLLCGNANPERFTSFAIFRDDVTMPRIQTNFFDYCRANDLKPTHVTYYDQENILFNVPFVNIYFPPPYLITYREIQLSGVLADSEPQEDR